MVFFTSGIFDAKISLLICLCLSYGLYRLSGRILLKWYNASKVGSLKNIYKKAGISQPHIYTFNSATPVSFTVGTSGEYNILVSTGAMKMFNVPELELLLAREVGHIKNGDVYLNTTVALVAGTLVGLANTAFWISLMLGFGRENDPVPRLIRLIVMGIVAPPAALLVKLLIPASREYAADSIVEELTGRSRMLPELLGGIENYINLHPRQVNPGHVHMFPVNALRVRDLYDVHISLFNTHPNLKSRINRLLEGMEYD